MRVKNELLSLLFLLCLLAASCGSDPSISEETVSDPTTPADSAASGSTASDPPSSEPDLCEEILFIYSNIHTSSDGGANIYATCPGDPSPRMVTYGQNWNSHPHWSPDRSQIAFLSDHSGLMQLHIIDRDGSNDRQLTFDSDLDTEGVIVLPDGSREFAGLVWLPDGNRVAVAQRGTEQFIWQAVDVITGEITPLDDLVLPSSTYAGSMSLSHDGRRIAYTDRTNPEGSESPVEIYIQDIDGSNPYQLTSTDWEIQNPVWSPDDSQIIFLSSTEYGTGQNTPDTIQNAIYIINLDGSNLHEPILTGLNPMNIAWSPDGELLAVITGEMQSTGDIFNPEKETITLNTLNIRTGEQTFLFKTESPNRIYNLSW